MANIELEEAPELVSHNKSEVAAELAVCMATPVLPDTGNGELVAKRTSQLRSEIENDIKERYVQEIQKNAGRSRIRRKRSLGDADLCNSEDHPDEGIIRLPSVPKIGDVKDISPEGEQLMQQSIEEVQMKHTLDLEDEEESSMNNGVFDESKEEAGENYFSSEINEMNTSNDNSNIVPFTRERRNSSFSSLSK